MRPIQTVLFLVFISLFVGYFSRFRKKLFDRLIVVLVFASATFMVAFPEITNTVAHTFGVGRGVDLLVYLGFVGFSFVLLVFYGKFQNLKREITVLARHIAIESAIENRDESPYCTHEVE